jgi:tocopherol cyclase
MWSGSDLEEGLDGISWDWLMNLKIWNPGVFHGKKQDQQFFEGWYYKLISPDREDRWAVIPGVFYHPDPQLRHCFVQVLNGASSQVTYHRFPVGEFQADLSEFQIQIAGSSFHSHGFSLDLDSEGQRVIGEAAFEGLTPWPVTLLSPGVMGPYRFTPLMQTYHGILSLDHTIQGQLLINDQVVDFSRGRGYMEKDWGRTFPRAYIWMQTNHFLEQGVSLTASVATIPWLSGWFRGFLVGLLVDGRLYRFTTYLGSEILSLTVDDHHVNWVLTGKPISDRDRRFSRLELTIAAERSGGGLLSSPELNGMTPRILESLTAVIDVDLKGFTRGSGKPEIIYQGKGTCGGLEIAGTIDEIIDQRLE